MRSLKKRVMAQADLGDDVKVRKDQLVYFFYLSTSSIFAMSLSISIGFEV
jgi:hypothetical protein